MNQRTFISRAPIVPERIRRIDGQSFSFLPSRFLRDGFFVSLTRDELALYIVLVLAGDRNGVSYYHYDKLCSILELHLDAYLRQGTDCSRRISSPTTAPASRCSRFRPDRSSAPLLASRPRRTSSSATPRPSAARSSPASTTTSSPALRSDSRRRAPPPPALCSRPVTPDVALFSCLAKPRPRPRRAAAAS